MGLIIACLADGYSYFGLAKIMRNQYTECSVVYVKIKKILEAKIFRIFILY